MVRRLRLGTATALVALVGWTGAVRAQEGAGQVWIQIEARNSLPAAEERLQRWSAELPGVTGFRLSSGWIAVAIGPFSPDEARARLSELRAAGMIPADSYIPDNRLLREQIWSDGSAPLAAPPLGAPIAPVTAAPLTDPAAPGPGASEVTSPAPEAPAETLAQSRAAEARLTREERRNIQEALAWAGTYTSAVDGAFGPGTRAAISEWQGRMEYDPTGVLSTAQRSELVGAWQAEVTALGLELVKDEEAGIQAVLPLGLVEFDRYAPPFVLYRPKAQSGMELRLISQPGDQALLEALYHDLAASGLVPSEGPRELRRGGFTLSGRDGAVEVHARAELDGAAIRGWLLRAPVAEADRSLRVMQSLSSGFKGIGRQVLDPGLVPIDEGLRAQLQNGLEPAPPRAALSGFYIDGAGQVMTALAPLEGCREVYLDNVTRAEVSWQDADLGLAVLRPATPLAPAVVAGFAAALPVRGAEAVLSGFSFGAGLSLPSVSFGRLEAGTAPDGTPGRATLRMAATLADAGGAVLGPDGLVIGVLLPDTEVAGTALPEGVSLIAPAPQILGGLGRGGPRLQAAPSQGGVKAPEDLTRIGSDLAVQVICRS
ncbi:peptidoglycan-binding protein [Falsigemmobacter faecalis]|uniref:Peptidoglycan-binding protein n=1 Tax=Falsigemmobacter faecalis TaxID=2488730 RepID=A0A3P3DJM7_9RHOB|nr:peptidoglycan-binding protein [Falsigemmobacter faecalis]RRH73906.1 peptidoglycan-binding protein [Falsigemmobacter faecalis]